MEVNVDYFEQRKDIVEGCVVTHKTGGFGGDTDQNILGESRWQELKKNLFWDKSSWTTLSFSITLFQSLNSKSDCLVGLGTVLSPDLTRVGNLDWRPVVVCWGRSFLTLLPRDREGVSVRQGQWLVTAAYTVPGSHHAGLYNRKMRENEHLWKGK